ncbi:hypothetical protein CR983_02545 [Candidatus Saccharibacteria bacterium]|nr:MAG: hypothetical protein CR983_02545 [Candidatus Saccharibacteria bacterium]
MIRWIVGASVVMCTTIIVISFFLAPNSLMNCSDAPSDIAGCERADVIIAVSGGDTRARTQEAIDLYQQGWADKLIFSGAALDKSGPSNAEVMRQQALAQNVPAAAIVVEPLGETTAENAEKTTSLLHDENTRTAILVTSSYHAKRTLLEFQSTAPDIEFRISPASGDSQWSVWWWTTPYGWYLAISELVKIVLLYISGGA